MLFLPLERIQPGMRLAKPITQPGRGGVPLLQAGVPLRRKVIARLIELGVRHAWVEFGPLPIPVTGISDAIVESHATLLRVSHAMVDAFNPQDPRSLVEPHVAEAVRGLLDEILLDPDHAPPVPRMIFRGTSFADHLANTCYISLLLGVHMSGYVRERRRRVPLKVADDLQHLGLGALLHDVGKLPVREDEPSISILDVARQADNAYRRHVLDGLRLVQGKVAATSAYVVAHHHQRWDGKGFPRLARPHQQAKPLALAGQRIHVFARIVAVADAFDHLLHEEDLTRPAVCALHGLLEPRWEGFFDEVIVAALVRLIPPFMVGSVVRLSDGTDAVVLENHVDAPCRPTVQRLAGPVEVAERPAAEPPVDLRLRRDVHVAEADGCDVSAWLYEPPPIDVELMSYWALRQSRAAAWDADASVAAAVGQESELSL